VAIRNVITGGIGLNTGVIGWIVTAGWGELSVAAAVTVTGKYAPEHASALEAVAGPHSFATEHASALLDVGRAGSGA
jgi:hypothetical protein